MTDHRPGFEASLDDINRPVWAEFVNEFISADSWTDQGERDLLNSLAPTIRNGRILDVGVGAGRTAWILPLLTDNYIGIDYTSQMVEAARKNHPDRDIRLGDARDLSEFSDDYFDFVMFSYNGIDALSHADRKLALEEFRRVLNPDGLLMFSTLDKNGRNFAQAPKLRNEILGDPYQLTSVARFVRHMPSHISHARREHENWRRLSARIEDHGDWGISPLAAQEFGLLVHFITPDGERDELEALGFEVKRIIDDRGVEVIDSAPQPSRSFFHVLAIQS